MKRHTPPSMRRANRVLPKLTTVLVVAALSVAGFLALSVSLKAPPYRETVLVVGSPVRLLSVSPAGSVTVLTVPEDTVIGATGGYGKYPIRSLVELDRIDNKGGALITGSVADALGIPITYFIDNGKEGTTPEDSDGVAFVRGLFSWGSLSSRVSGRVHTTMPAGTWLRYVWSLRFVPADQVESVDVEQAVANVTAPDGSVRRELDESKLDYILATALFDTGLRAEGLTVAVYNTTNIPTVGLRAARQLSRVGLQLVFVGNAENNTEGCIVGVNSRAKSTKTVRFIEGTFHCAVADIATLSTGRETGADVVVLLGKAFAEKYQ